MFRKQRISIVGGIVCPYFVTSHSPYISKRCYKNVNSNHNINLNAKYTNSNDKQNADSTDNTEEVTPTPLYPGHITTSLFQKGIKNP